VLENPPLTIYEPLATIKIKKMEQTYFILSKGKIKSLFWYFGILLFIGLILTIYVLVNEMFLFKLNVTSLSLIGGIGMALLGSTIFYFRKLYKSAINNILNTPQNENDKVKETGLHLYYFLRPIFSIVFAVLIHIGLKASVAIVTVKETNLDEGMIYLTMIISFFIGFASGDVITKLENVSKEIANKTIEKIT